MKKILTVIMPVLIAVSLFSCSKGSADFAPNEKEYSYRGELSDSGYAVNKNEASGSDKIEQKLVVTSVFECETKDFDGTYDAIKKSVSDLGGYISKSTLRDSSYGNRRSLTLTVRIPTDRYEEFDSFVSEAISVLYKSSNIDDITESYYKAESTYNSLLVQEERLLAMLEKCEKLSDMLTLEDKLSEIRGNIEYYETLLKTYDNKVAYSTIDITVNEVAEYTPIKEPSFGERISDAFKDSWSDFAQGCSDFAVWLVEAFPTLLVIAIIAIIIILLIKLSVKRRKKKKQIIQDQSNGAK